MSARSVGVAVGLVVSGLSIAGNLWRGDPHLSVTTVPDVFTALVMAAVICLGLYRVATQEQVAVGASQGVIRAARASSSPSAWEPSRSCSCPATRCSLRASRHFQDSCWSSFSGLPRILLRDASLAARGRNRDAEMFVGPCIRLAVPSYCAKYPEHGMHPQGPWHDGLLARGCPEARARSAASGLVVVSRESATGGCSTLTSNQAGPWYGC